LKKLLFILLSIINLIVFAQEKIVLTEENLGQSFTKSSVYLLDDSHELTIDDILDSSLIYKPFNLKLEKLGFTSASYWFKFEVENKTENSEFIFFISRTIADEVVLYEIENNEVKAVQRTGDQIKLAERTIKTIDNAFPIKIKKGESSTFVLKLKSDGEALLVPIIINSTKGYFLSTRLRSFFLGSFYGILLTIIILYVFYYLGMKDKSLLLYSTYVSSVFLLQFTLDGLSYFYVLKYFIVFEQYIIVFSAALASALFLVYVKSFLKLKDNFPRINKVFKLFVSIFILIIILTFIPGQLHVLSYPLVNGFSLISLILAFWTVVYLKVKGEDICIYFSLAVFTIAVGAIIFILTNFRVINHDFLFKYALKTAVFIEVLLLAMSMSNKLRGLQKEKEIAQEKSLASLKEKNNLIDLQNEMLSSKVKERTEELEEQKEQLSEKNREVIDSINYAKRLQDALMPTIEKVKEIVPDSFVLFKPKDIVSGDFYWIKESKTTFKDKSNSEIIIMSVADCTGHGVPGAFMSIIGLNIFNQTLKEESVNTPAQALDYLNAQMYNTVNKHNNNVIRDGMDLSFCTIDKKSLELTFSGAKNSLYIIRNLELIELKGDKQPIGYSEHAKAFTLQTFQLERGDMIYASTDGYADQFGGERGKKYKYKPFKNLLIEISTKEVSIQKEILDRTFKEWKGNLEQLDDICIVGIRI